MSKRGNVFDKAAMESWNSALKSELGKRFETNAAAKDRLFAKSTAREGHLMSR
jgi:hypothetical protein